MTLRDVLTELSNQQKLAADQRDVLWRDYFQSRRVVVVRDDVRGASADASGAGRAESTAAPHTLRLTDHEVHVLDNVFKPNKNHEVLKILRGALAQPNIGAARPMIRTAIERLEGEAT